MLRGADPLRALELLDEAGVTAVVLPPLAELRGVGQSANHHLDVHDHTIEVLRRWLEIERDLPRYAGDVADEVAAALAEPLADDLTRRDGIRFAAILHDIGKPATRTEQDGFVGFRGHDAVGAEMIRELCAELRTSRRFADYEAAIARDHLILGFMTHERPLSRRRIWDYLSRTGREALDTTLLTVADRLSAQGSGVPAAAIDAHLDLAREMLAEIVVIERERPRRRRCSTGPRSSRCSGSRARTSARRCASCRPPSSPARSPTATPPRPPARLARAGAAQGSVE